MTPVLEAVRLTRRFGGIQAVSEVSLTLEPGARHALIGPNGAGKTTLVNLLTGMLEPDGGRVMLDGRDVTRLPQHARAAHGLVRTFQVTRLFPDLTPLEAVTVAICQRDGRAASWWRPVLHERAAIEEAARLIERLGLADVRDEPTAVIGYGRQRLLEIALALACGPRVLLLDEPAAGLAQEERSEILLTIERLPGDVAVLLIEHDMDLVFRYARRITVMVGGAVLVEGPPEAIAADRRVRAAYLGEPADA